MTDNFDTDSVKKFYCKKCDVLCSKKSYFDRHILTRKHQNTDKILPNTDVLSPILSPNLNTFLCDCGKAYKHRQSLFNHRKKCLNKCPEKCPEIVLHNKSFNENEIILTLLQQNNELHNQIIKLCNETKNVTTINAVNSQINSNNKTFNLNVFLNETCKDAMNINEFIDSLKLQLSDLESVGKLGYVEGISNIIVTNLNSLDETKRPIHCTDQKRDILYVKDENKWEKEHTEKRKIRKAIHRIANKNYRLLPEFKEKYPDCIKSSSKFSDQFNKIIIEALGGSGDNDLEKEDKIIKKVAKNVLINKN